MKKLIIVLLLFSSFVISSSAQSFQWLNRMGGAYQDPNTSPDEVVRDIQIDALGNVYACGRVLQNADFGGTTVTSYGYYDVFIAKYNCEGNLLWVKTAGSDFYDEAYALKLDNFGHIYLTGYLKSGNGDTTHFFDSTFVMYGSAMFLAKFDTSGNYLWGKIAGSPSSFTGSSGLGLQLDFNGNPVVYLGSTLTGDLFPGWPVSRGAYLAKFDTSGNINQIFLYSSTTGLNDFVIDSQNRYNVTGKFYLDTVMIGNQTLINPHPGVGIGNYVFYTAQFLSNGQLSWIYLFTDTLTAGVGAEGFGITTDPSDNIYVMGSVSPGLKCNNFIFTDSLAPISNVTFVLKLNSSGQVIWVNQSQKSYSGDDSGKIARKSNGNLVISGTFSGLSIFGNDTIDDIFPSPDDLYISELDPNGNFIHTVKLDGVDREISLCTKVDSQDNIYIGGGFNANLYTATTSIQNQGGYTDGFIAKYGTICTVGIKELERDENTFDVYPNPAYEIINLKFNNTLPLKVILSNLTGQNILSSTSISSEELRFDISKLTPGMYLLKAEFKNKNEVKKIIVE